MLKPRVHKPSNSPSPVIRTEKTKHIRNFLVDIEKSAQKASPSPHVKRNLSKSPQQPQVTNKQPNELKPELILKMDICANDFKELIKVMSRPSIAPLETTKKPSNTPSSSKVAFRQRSRTPEKCEKSSKGINKTTLSKSPLPVKTPTATVMTVKKSIPESKEVSSPSPNICSNRYLPRSRSHKSPSSAMDREEEQQHLRYLKNHLRELKDCVNLDSNHKGTDYDCSKAKLNQLNDFELRLKEFERRKKLNVDKLKEETNPKFKPQINPRSALIDKMRMQGMTNSAKLLIQSPSQPKISSRPDNSRERSVSRGNIKNPNSINYPLRQSNSPNTQSSKKSPLKSALMDQHTSLKVPDDQQQRKILQQIDELMNITFKLPISKKK